MLQSAGLLHGKLGSGPPFGHLGWNGWGRQACTLQGHWQGDVDLWLSHIIVTLIPFFLYLPGLALPGLSVSILLRRLLHRGSHAWAGLAETLPGLLLPGLSLVAWAHAAWALVAWARNAGALVAWALDAWALVARACVAGALGGYDLNLPGLLLPGLLVGALTPGLSCLGWPRRVLPGHLVPGLLLEVGQAWPFPNFNMILS